MQVELIGGPLDGKVLGVPNEDCRALRFPYMRDPIYMSWTGKQPPTPEEVKLDAYDYERIKGLSDKGYTRFKYVKGT